MSIKKSYVFIFICSAFSITAIAIAVMGQYDAIDPTPEKPTTLYVTGDVMLGRYVNAKATEENDFTWPFKQIASVLQEADIAFINLESPLVEDCPLTTQGLIFCGDLRHVAGLKSAGVDIAGIANNHAENYGAVGIANTEAALTSVNILTTGLEDIPIITSNGTKFSFLAYDDINTSQYIKQANTNTVASDIATASERSDIVIVMYHWGHEYTHQPSQRQRQLAYAAIDAGADLVVGNHPHWIQPPEHYKEKTIVYSHGNFIFDQNWSRKTSQGVIGKYTFQGNEHIRTEFIPVVIENNGQPRQATPSEAIEITKLMEIPNMEVKPEVEIDSSSQ